MMTNLRSSIQFGPQALRILESDSQIEELGQHTNKDK